MNKQLPLPEDSDPRARNAFLIARLIAIAHFLAVAHYLYEGWTSGTWQFLALAAISFALGVISGIGAVLSKRGQPARGIILVLGVLAVSYPPIAILAIGLGSVLGPALMVVGMMSAFQVLPQRSGRVITAVTIISGLATLLLDIFGSAARPALAGYFIPFLAVSVTGLVGFFIARQAWRGTLRSKLLTAFIGVTVMAAGALGIFMYITTSNNLQDNLERELSALAVDRATRIGGLFNEQINALTTLSLNEVLLQTVNIRNMSYEGGPADIQATLDAKDAQWRAADAANNNNDPLVRQRLNNAVSREVTKYRQTFPDNVEVFVTDVYGGLVGSTNRTSDYYQADEGWWQAAYNDGQGGVYISEPEFDESAGAIAVLIALPMRDLDTGEITGILRTTYILSPLTAILTEEIGQTGEADLFMPGEVVAHIHEGNFEQVETAEFEALQAVAGQGMVEMDYEGAPSVVTQAQVRTLVGNPFIDKLGWVVVFHQQRNEAFAPVNAQVRGLVFVMAIVVALAAAAAYALSQLLVRPIIRLTATAEEVSAGNLDSRAEVSTSDEVGTLATTFNSMTSQLQETLQGLEQRVAERTRNLELAAEVGRSVSQVRALDVMLRDACELIRNEFDLYYVQVYLTDPSQTELLLQAGTGEVGVQLLERKHRLQLNTGSINGRAAVEKRTVVISNTIESATFRPNPLLPDTRAEMAVPLIVADSVVGVLDMQSSHPGTLTEEVLPAFEALAGQLAIAIQNANLLAETEQARTEVEAQARRLVRKNWEEYLDAIHQPEQTGFVFEGSKVIPLSDAIDIQPAAEGNSIQAPIAITGESLGSLIVEMDAQELTPQNTELVNIIARQVAQQIENLRLLESAERYRSEAEQAARRQTREGWQKYIESRTKDSLGYLYDLKEVRPYNNGHEDGFALTLPLKARDEMVGKLSVQGLAPEDKESYELTKAVAERLGAHIESLRLFEETKQGQVELDRRAQQLAAVAEISTASSQEMEMDKLLSTVVQLTQRQFGLYHTHVFIYDEAAEELRIAACGWKEGDENEGTNETVSIPIGQEQSLVARAARTRQVVIVNDVKSESGWLANPLLPDTASEMAVPLVIGDQVLGVMDVQSDHVNAFSEEDANIQMTLASQVATAMQNARSFAQAQQQAEREAMLNTISQKIQSATSVEAVLQIAARELGHALGAPLTIAQLGMKDHSDNGSNRR